MSLAGKFPALFPSPQHTHCKSVPDSLLAFAPLSLFPLTLSVLCQALLVSCVCGPPYIDHVLITLPLYYVPGSLSAALLQPSVRLQFLYLDFCSLCSQIQHSMRPFLHQMITSTPPCPHSPPQASAPFLHQLS